MAISYRIQEADLSTTAAAIQRLWVSNLGGHDPHSAAAKLRLGYVDNPAGRGCALLLYPEGDSRPTGVQGLHPRVFHFGSQRLTVAGLADYAVDSAHRSLGPALMLMRHGCQIGAERFDLTYGLPNQKAAAVLARAGLKRFGMVRRFARPLCSRALLAQRLPSWLAALGAPMVDVLLRLRDEWRTLTQKVRLECRDASWDDPALDEVWAHRPASLVLSDRSAAMLRWRFGTPERGHWQVCIACDAAGVALGHTIWRLRDGVAEIGDFFTSDPERLTAPLMLAFARRARRAGASSISVLFFGRKRVARGLLTSGMALRPQQAPLFRLPGGPPELDSPERWYLTNFDDDAD